MAISRFVCGVCLLLVVTPHAAIAQEARWNELNTRVGSLYKQDRFADAIRVAEETLQVARQTFGENDPRTAASHSDLALLNYALGRHLEASQSYQRALRIREQSLGPEHPAVATTLNDLANVYRAQRKYAETEPLFKRALSIREKALGPTHIDVAVSLNNLGELYTQQARFADAASLYLRALGILEKGPGRVSLVITLNNLGLLYSRQGKYDEAEPQYKRALQQAETILGSEHPLVASVVGNLAALYRAQARHGDAEALYRRALAIREKVFGSDHPEVAASLNGLGVLLADQAKYSSAEQQHLRALRIREKALGPTHLDVAESLNNLAMLHDLRGQEAEAERRYQQALQIQEAALGPSHPDLAITLNNLAERYRSKGEPAKAESLHTRALNIRRDALGPGHPTVAESLNNLGMLYLSQRNLAPAEVHFHQAIAIYERALGPEHPTVTIALNNLAKVYQEQGKYAESERTYLKALHVKEAVWGKDHPSSRETLWNLGTLYYGWNRPLDAQPYFERGLASLGRQLEQEFSYLSENERLVFMETVRFDVPLFLSFCFSLRDRSPSLAGRMYDVLLLQKGIVAAGASAIRARIARSGDNTATEMFTALTEKKRQLVRRTSSPGEDRQQWQRDIATIAAEVLALERDLVARSSAFALEQRPSPMWQMIRDRLKPGEAAVEFVRFPFYDGKQWTGATQYAAVVIKASTRTSPTIVSLGDAETLECGPLNEYSLRIAPLARQGVPCRPEDGKSALALTPTFYQAFWKPLEPALADATRVYVSLDGVLHQLSLNVVADESGTLLIDKYDVRTVLSTRDLLSANADIRGRSAVLIGNPLFTVDEAVQVAAARTYRSSLRGLDSDADAANASGRAHVGLRGPPWDPLPGTSEELDRVARALRGHGWTVAAHEGKDAVVEVIKAVRAPRVLHVATHGEFAASPGEMRRETFSVSGRRSPGQPSILDDPMLRSGLFFTGGNRYRAGLPPPAGADDGVLTAYEASQLDLNGTELVVLSACKTGLGQARDSEGVFGLRRAFQIAGAQSVMMAMWSVPDSETQMLMTRFYEKWTAGVDKHEALRAAQRELRKESPDPSSWGAFVLVGR